MNEIRQGVEELRVLISMQDCLHEWDDGGLNRENGDKGDNFSCVCDYKKYMNYKKKLSDKIEELENLSTLQKAKRHNNRKTQSAKDIHIPTTMSHESHNMLLKLNKRSKYAD